MTRTPKPWLCGPLTHGKAGRHHVDPPLNLPPPTRVTNSTQPNMTPEDFARLPRPFIREGADHSHLQSKGQGC